MIVLDILFSITLVALKGKLDSIYTKLLGNKEASKSLAKIIMLIGGLGLGLGYYLGSPLTPVFVCASYYLFFDSFHTYFVEKRFLTLAELKDDLLLKDVISYIKDVFK